MEEPEFIIKHAIDDNPSERFKSFGHAGEVRVEPQQTSIREPRGNEREVLPKLIAKNGDISDGQFWGRVYTTMTDDKKHVYTFPPDKIHMLNFTDLPIYFEHCYPAGVKVPEPEHLKPELYSHPTEKSVPVGHVLATDSTTVPGEVWIKVGIDFAGIPPAKEALLRRLLRSGELSGISPCYSFDKKGGELHPGSEPPSARIRFNEKESIIGKEVSIVAAPDWPNSRIIYIKASEPGSATQFANMTSTSAPAPSADAPAPTGGATAIPTPATSQSPQHTPTPLPPHQQQQQQQQQQSPHTPSSTPSQQPSPSQAAADALARQTMEQLRTLNQQPAATPQQQQPPQQQRPAVDESMMQKLEQLQQRYEEQQKLLLEQQNKWKAAEDAKKQIEIDGMIKEALKVKGMTEENARNIISQGSAESRKSFMDFVHQMTAASAPAAPQPTPSQAPQQPLPRGFDDPSSKLWSPVSPANVTPLARAPAASAQMSEDNEMLEVGAKPEDVHPIIQNAMAIIDKYPKSLANDKTIREWLNQAAKMNSTGTITATNM
jgi:hypothetical protein